MVFDPKGKARTPGPLGRIPDEFGGRVPGPLQFGPKGGPGKGKSETKAPKTAPPDEPDGTSDALNEKVAKELGFEDGKGGKIEHVVEKVIEDREGKVLPAASTVVHDVKTGNLWLSGFASKFITVCEPKVG